MPFSPQLFTRRSRSGGVPGSDTYWTFVKLLMGMEGANLSTGAPGLTDESSAAHGTATSGASSTIETAQFQFGSSSYRMHTVVGNSCNFADSADWQLSTANSDQFTVEGWWRFASLGTPRTLIGQSNGDGTFAWTLEQNSTNTNSELQFLLSFDGTFANISNITTSGAGIAINTWYAIAVDKDASGKIRVYRNGVVVGSSTPANSAIFNAATGLGICCLATPANRMDGWIDELRITKGVARYASDSGYTVSATAFPRF